ncbi:hypothetical protein LXA43DRAFT_956618 [Ganoderma leucocontextum]|nr:hypothetical protein LXA43DRAFT_956618 [Ganoderma leucocontextum]
MLNKAAEGQMGWSVLPELVEGKELHLCLQNTSSSSSSDRMALTCTIEKAFRPFTLSPVLLVSLAHPSSTSPDGQVSLPASAILKLYDRRCLVNNRETYDEGEPWSLDKEREYQRYLDDVATGAVARADFASPRYWRDDRFISDGEFEAYLQHTAQKVFHAELATYERLRALQGSKIPRLYGVVEYEVVIPDACSDGSAVTETVPGLLLEYIPSLTLRELIATWTARDPPLPNGTLATLCEEVVKVVDRVSDFDVLNKDVRMDNFLIRQPFLASSSHGGEDPAVVDDAVVLIDLGQCRLRGKDESEEEWEEAKWLEDEADAAGVVTLSLVRKFVGDEVWTYKRSRRYCRPPEWLITEDLRRGLPAPGSSVLS